MGFRLASFALFVSIIILFNVWHCSRNRRSPAAKKDNLIEEAAPPRFNKTRKIILAVAGFFLLSSFVAQIHPMADKLKLEKAAEKVPEHITNKVAGEDQHQKLGQVEKMDVAEVKKKNEENWGVFGKWDEMAVNCWLIIGGIIICLLAKQSIMGNLTAAIQGSIPLVLIYIFAAVPAAIIQKSGMSENLAKFLLPTTAKTAGPALALLAAFGTAFLITFIVGSTTAIATTLIGAFAPTLLAFGQSTLIYAALFAWIGAILGMAFSPNNGILRASLEKSQTPYKQFIKKVWILGLIMFLTAIGLVCFWTKFVI